MTATTHDVKQMSNIREDRRCYDSSEKHDVRDMLCNDCNQVHKEYLMQGPRKKCESTNEMNKYNDMWMCMKT